VDEARKMLLYTYTIEYLLSIFFIGKTTGFSFQVEALQALDAFLKQAPVEYISSH
jgi:hypothetical protein